MYRIVLIDDEPWSAAVLKESIDWKELGFYIDRLYTNPVEALRAICADPPDVVITDISMPVLDGLELIRKAQFDGCTSRFVILSAHRNFDYAKAALRLDVVDYYLKPIRPEEISTLFSSIKATLDEEHNLSPGETLPAGRFEEILAYIDANLHQHLTLQSISDTFFLNRTYICALFKKHLDVTFSQYLTSARLEKAKFYLSHTNLKQLEIAEKVGFKDEFYFSKVFKKRKTCLPGSTGSWRPPAGKSPAPDAPGCRSIQKSLLHLFLTACLLFLCLLAAACWWFASSQRKALEEHLGATLTIMGENIDEYFMSLEKLGFGVSSNWSVINVYSGEDPTEVGSAVANSHQLMSLLCSIETSIADVMIVDINGLGKSYFSGVDYNIISEITSQEELHDPYALERSFHFFPPESQWSNVYFVYSVPILNLNSWPSDSQKVATGLLLCNKSRISRLLMTDTALSYEYFALYQGDDCVFSSSPVPPEPGPNTLIQEIPLARGGLTLRGAATLGQVQGGSGLMLLFGGCCFLAVTLFLILLVQFTRRYILRPISGTISQLAGYQGENLSEHIAYSGVGEIDAIIVDINRMIDKIKCATRQILLTQNTLYETELRTKEAELYALQSQVNPHFLYNTLQCICGLAAMGRTRDIQEIALAMSDVFKYSIHPGTFVDCAEEVGIICQYLSIYKIRYDGKLDYELNIEEPLLDCRILKMIIQPTVENAMLHAYNGTDKRPAIRIYGRREDGELVFNIIDNGAGIPREKLQKIQENLGRSFSESIQKASPFGLGLYNINRRIKLVYGESYGISLFSNPNGTQVDIRIPAAPPEYPALPEQEEL